jgi:hypothetical protein
VDEAEGALGSFLDGDDKHAVGSAAGNGTLVCLMGIGSVCRQSLSGAYVHHASLDRGHPVRVGESVTDKATRGSRRMSVAFQVASEGHTRMWSSSSPTPTTRLRGDPSAWSVV